MHLQRHQHKTTTNSAQMRFSCGLNVVTLSFSFSLVRHGFLVGCKCMLNQGIEQPNESECTFWWQNKPSMKQQKIS